MTVIILGAGVMQIPAIMIAKELGWTVVVADGKADAPGAELADRFLHVDLKDLEGLAASARGVRAEFGLDGVFTAGTDFSASVAYVARQLGLPGIPFETALRCSDKLLMRAALAEAGVPIPRYAEVSGQGDAGRVAAELGFPLVVKPADSMGARGCRAARDRAELAAAIAAALPYSRTGRAIVEEFVEGPEYSIDALVFGDEIRVRGLADRHIYFDPYFVELGHTMPSACAPEIEAELLRVFRLGVRALGIGLGAAKGDIKYCPSRGCAVIGEIAARLSGGYMSGWTYPYSSGIDVTREALLLCVGEPLGPRRPSRGWHSAERAFISIPGTVAAVEGRVEAERMPYVKNVFLRALPGERVVFPSNNVEKCGNVISQAPTREAAAEAAESAVRAIRIRLKPDDPETEAFLRGEWKPEGRPEGRAGSGGRAWPPLAFELGEEAARALAAMPDYLDAADLRGEAGDAGPGFLPPFSPFDPEAGGACLDRLGRSYAESAALAAALAGAPRAAPGRDASPALVPAGRFWRALERGGLQAALYVLDTEAARRGGGA